MIEQIANYHKAKINSDLSLFKISTSIDTHEFHQSIPGYIPTNLNELSKLSKQLSVKNIWIKDESTRFDLNSFKILGASYAIAKAINNLLELNIKSIRFNDLVKLKNRIQDITLTTATDGNHGRAVAWMANNLGIKAVIYLPKTASNSRVKAINNLGAKAIVFDGNYDEAVEFAYEKSRKKNWILIQDTALKNYVDIPVNIIAGYSTIMNEVEYQLNDERPTHIFIQAGVGSFASSVLSYIINKGWNRHVKFIVVEPEKAACYYQSIKNSSGEITKVSGDLDTIMDGLACGIPNFVSWDLMKNHTNHFLKCSDEIAEIGISILSNPIGNDPKIISGASGAVTIGLIHSILSENKYKSIKNNLHLDSNSKILLVSTEGNNL